MKIKNEESKRPEYKKKDIFPLNLSQTDAIKPRHYIIEELCQEKYSKYQILRV